MTESVILWLAGIVIVYLGGYFGFVKDVVKRISVLETNDKIYWQVISPHLATIIHSPNHQERDRLVDKFVNSQLTREEAFKLECLLQQNIDENNNPDKVLASALLLARLKTVLSTWRK